MIIEKAKPRELDKIKELYESAFPSAERKPFALILKKVEEGSMEILALTEDGAFCGLAILILCGGDVLLDYFAVTSEMRCRGLGKTALALLRERCSGKRFILEIERCDENAENYSERVRRKNFYLRCGMRETNLEVSLFGVDMEILASGGEITFEEYVGIYRSVFGEKAAEKITAAEK